jgi:hypothetical protein
MDAVTELEAMSRAREWWRSERKMLQASFPAVAIRVGNVVAVRSVEARCYCHRRSRSGWALTASKSQACRCIA